MSIFRRKPQAPKDTLDQDVWTEADKALAKTRLESSKAMAEWPLVERVHESLTHQLEQNNFAERIRLAMVRK